MNKKLLTIMFAAGILSAGTYAFNMWFHQGNYAPIDKLPTSGKKINHWPIHTLPVGNPKILNDAKTTVKHARKQIHNEMKENAQKMRETMWKMHEKIKQEKTQLYKWIRTNMRKMHANIKAAFKSLDDTKKQALRKIQEEYRPQIRALFTQLRSATKEQRKEIFSKIKKLRTELHTKIIEATKWTDFATKFGEKIKIHKQMIEKMHEKMKEMRNNLTETKKTFKEARQDLVVKWKKLIISKLFARIEKMSLAKLEKIDTRIDKAVEKVKNRTKLTEDRKQKIISALDALKQVITERINELKTTVDTEEKQTMDVLNSVINE